MPRHLIEEKYRWSILKEYPYWTLLLHEKPGPFLGRGVVWLTRDGTMQRFSSVTPDELSELQLVLKEYECAVEALWKPDHMNYLWLGNFFHEHGGHGHMHVIPRYKETRSFEGLLLKDVQYGNLHSPFEQVEYGHERLLRMHGAILAELNKQTPH